MLNPLSEHQCVWVCVHGAEQRIRAWWTCNVWSDVLQTINEATMSCFWHCWQSNLKSRSSDWYWSLLHTRSLLTEFQFTGNWLNDTLEVLLELLWRRRSLRRGRGRWWRLGEDLQEADHTHTHIFKVSPQILHLQKVKWKKTKFSSQSSVFLRLVLAV